jgi:hypothetical protein
MGVRSDERYSLCSSKPHLEHKIRHPLIPVQDPRIQQHDNLSARIHKFNDPNHRNLFVSV